MKKKKKSKGDSRNKYFFISKFNELIDKKIASGIEPQYLPSKVKEKESKNLTKSDAEKMLQRLKSFDFKDTTYDKEGIVLSEGLIAVDEVRMKAQNRYQKEKRERMSKLPSYPKEGTIDRISMDNRGDMVDLTAGDKWLSPKERAQRIRSHEEFYEDSGGRRLKNLLRVTIENESPLQDVSEYLDWVDSLDDKLIEEAYYSSVSFDFVEFYKGEYTDKFVDQLETFQQEIKKVAEQNETLHKSISQKALRNTTGKFYSVSKNIKVAGKTQKVDFGIVYKKKVGKSNTGYVDLSANNQVALSLSRYLGKKKGKVKIKYEEFT